jgi:isoquinoline 1-oxidoreductase alpha subunit
MALTLTVNGVARRVDADPATPLLWILRDTLGLCGTKYGCGNGLCGACTVHLDGEAYRSCQVQVSDVGKKRVTTIEGLSPDGSHPCQRAWLEEDVSQCGYCQPGMLMATAALLREKPRPAGRREPRAGRSRVPLRHLPAHPCGRGAGLWTQRP